jgi:hypothetical protein
VPTTKNFSHIKPALAHGEHIALQHAWKGGPAQSTMRAEAPGENIQQAGLWSTAPYKEPAPKKPKAPHCQGKDGTCKAALVRGLDYCVFHARQLGIYDAWTKEESSTSKD